MTRLKEYITLLVRLFALPFIVLGLWLYLLYVAFRYWLSGGGMFVKYPIRCDGGEPWRWN